MLYRVALFFIVMVAFHSVINFEYMEDDYIVQAQNVYVAQGFSGITDIIFSPRTSGYVDYSGEHDGTYRPLPLIVNAIECQFFGFTPSISHGINLLLYGLACVFFFNFSLNFVKDSKQALLVSLLFAVLPVHAEVIGNIKCRDEIFGLIFFLLTLDRYLKVKKLDLLILLFFTCAFLSKESSIILLPILFLFSKNKIKELRSFFFLGFYSLLLIYWHHLVIEVDKKSVISDFEDNVLLGTTLFDRIPVILNNFYNSVKLLFSGLGVRYDYSYPAITLEDPINPFSFLSILFVGFLLCFKKTRLLTGCFLFSWLFISNLFFLVGTVFAERLLLISSIFTTVIIFYLTSFTRLQNILLIFFAVFGLSINLMNLPAWENEHNKAAFSKNLDVIGVKGLSEIGLTEFKQGKYITAEKYFKRRLFLNPGVDIIALKLVVCYLITNRLEEGKKVFIELLKTQPTVRYVFCLGLLEERLGNPRAKEYINHAISKDFDLKTIYESKDLLGFKL